MAVSFRGGKDGGGRKEGKSRWEGIERSSSGRGVGPSRELAMIAKHALGGAGRR